MIEVKCIVCQKPFLKPEEPVGGVRLSGGARQSNCVTCSKHCSRVYSRVYSKAFNILKKRFK